MTPAAQLVVLAPPNARFRVVDALSARPGGKGRADHLAPDWGESEPVKTLRAGSASFPLCRWELTYGVWPAPQI